MNQPFTENTLRRAAHLLYNCSSLTFPRKESDWETSYRKDQICEVLELLRKEIASFWEQRTSKLPSDIEPIDPEFGHLMPIADWLQACQTGCFIDYDGSGCLATSTHKSDVVISPSDVTLFQLSMPSWATHVVWYNK